MALVGTGKGSTVVTEWMLESEQFQKDLDNIAKKIKKQQKIEKNLDIVRKDLEKTTSAASRQMENLSRSSGRASTSMSSMFKTIAGGVTAGNMASKAMSFLGDKIVDLARQSNTYSKAANVYSGNIEAARKATRGLVSETEIMVAKNKLHTLGIKVTDQEYVKMLGNVTKLSEAMNIDLSMGLDSLAIGLARQSIRVLDNLGVTFKLEKAYEKFAGTLGKTAGELTDAEKKTAFLTEALTQMENKSAELPDRARTASELVAGYFTSMSDSIVKAIARANQEFGEFLTGDDQRKREAAFVKKHETSRFEFLTNKIADMKEGITELDRAGVSSDKLRVKLAKLQIEWIKLKEETETLGLKPQKEFSIDLERSKKFAKEQKKAKKKPKAAAITPSSFDLAGTTTGALLGLPQIELMDNYIDAYEQRLAEAKRIQEQYAQSGGGYSSNEERFNEALARRIEKEKELKQAMVDRFQQTIGPMVQFTGSIWQAADAAVAGSDSFVGAMLKMTKATLMGIAQQATVKAAWHAAEAAALWWTGGIGVAAELAAAAKYAGVAALAGTAGLAISASTSSSGTMSSRGASMGDGGPQRSASGQRSAGGSGEGTTYVSNIYSEGANVRRGGNPWMSADTSGGAPNSWMQAGGGAGSELVGPATAGTGPIIRPVINLQLTWDRDDPAQEALHNRDVKVTSSDLEDYGKYSLA